MSKRKTVYLGLLVSLVFLYFAFSGTSIRQVWLNIRELNSSFVMAAGTLIIAEFVLRAVRWKFLLNPKSAPKINGLFSVLMIGYFTNNIIPFRMGELVRAHLLGTNYKVNRAEALATIVVERVCDMVTLLAVFGFCVLMYDAFPVWIKRGGALAAAACLGFAVLLYLYCHSKRGLIARVRAFARNGRFAEKLAVVMENFSAGLTVLSNFKNISIVLCLSVLIWVLVIASISMVLQAFSLELPVFASVLVVVLVGLGMLLPAPPGNIGVYEGFAILALVPFGVERDVALGFSLVLHFLELAITTAIGFTCFVREVGFARAGAMRLWPRASVAPAGDPPL